MPDDKRTYPEIQTGQLWEVEGEIYELIDMRVTAVESPEDFLTTAFFRSKDPGSNNPVFEEKIKTILSDPVFKRYFEPEKLDLGTWLKTVPEPSGRLYNILRRICLSQFNCSFEDISPMDITKDLFLEEKMAGIKSWEEFEKLRNTNSK